MYKIIISKKVAKFLDKNKDLNDKFLSILKEFWVNPFGDNSILDIKILKWEKNKFRLRLWKYRFLYEIIKDEIIIFFYNVWSRWDIYKK